MEDSEKKHKVNFSLLWEALFTSTRQREVSFAKSNIMANFDSGDLYGTLLQNAD